MAGLSADRETVPRMLAGGEAMNGHPILGAQMQISISAIQDGGSTVFVASADNRVLGMARVTCPDPQILGLMAQAMGQAAAQAARGLVAAPAGLAERFKT